MNGPKKGGIAILLMWASMAFGGDSSALKPDAGSGQLPEVKSFSELSYEELMELCREDSPRARLAHFWGLCRELNDEEVEELPQ